MLKECPTCKRTYSDPSITFCLADGSLLSAPFDPQATLHFPASHNTESPPVTEVMYPASEVISLPPTPQAIEVTELPPTIASAEASSKSDDSVLLNQPNANSTALAGLSGSKGVKLWVVLGGLFTLAAIYTQSIVPVLPALLMFVIALYVGLKKSNYEQL
jgi:hypothetical protein